MNRINKITFFIFAGILIFSAYFIFSDFLIMPRVGWDEGMNLQLARNLAEFGRWQIQTYPGVFSDSAQYYSTGWTLLIPVAIVFKLFGVSFFTARMVTAFYLLGFLIVVYLLAKHWFGVRKALASTFLLATFAPIYSYGKPALGEIPALFWLALGIYFFESMKQKDKLLRYAVLGVCFGLSAASKLTYVILFSPVVAIMVLIYFFKRQISLKQTAVFSAVFILMILPNIWFSLIRPAIYVGLDPVLNFLANNHNSSCLFCDVKNNFMKFVSERSFIYTGFLIALSFFIACRYWIKNKKLPWFTWGCLLYCFFTMLYFFRSPGIARYLLPVQAMLVFAAPFLVFEGVKVFFKKENFKMPIYWLAIFLLMGMHLAHLVIAGYASSSLAPLELEQYLKYELPGEGRVGVINITLAPPLISSDRLINFLIIDKNGLAEGVNPLSLPENDLPKFIIYDETSGKNVFAVEPFAKKMGDNYKKIAEFGVYSVLEKQK